MKLTAKSYLAATLTVAAALGAAGATREPAGASGKIYDVGIYWDKSPNYSDPFCPMHLRFTAEVSSAKLAPGQSRALTYHWQTGKGKVYKSHTMTLPPDMDITEPTYPPGQSAPADPYAPTPIPRQRNQESAGLDFHMSHSFQDHVVFVITSPVHEVTDSGPLDILCH